MLKFPDASNARGLDPAMRASPYGGYSPMKMSITQGSFFSPKKKLESPKATYYPTTPKTGSISPRTNPLVHRLVPSYTVGQYSPKVNVSDSTYYANRDSVLPFGFSRDKSRSGPDMIKMEYLFQEEIENKTEPKKPKEDVDGVKRLDEWQMGLKRAQGLGNIMKPAELLEQHMRREVKDTEPNDFPKVRQDIFNKIISDTDNEEEGRKYKKDKLPSIMPDSKTLLGSHPMDFGSEGGKSGVKGLDVMQREYNKEILNDLINKKVNEYLKTIDIREITEEQLRVHVKKLAESVLAQFKTLKGPSGTFIVHNCVETTIKDLKHRKEAMERGFLDSPKENSHDEELVLDYETMEDVLMEKFVVCEQQTDDLRTKVKEITLEIYQLKKEFMACRTQLEALQKKNGNISNITELVKTPTKVSSAKKTKEGDAGSRLYKAHMAQIEKENEEMNLTRRLMEVKDKISYKTQELESKERELEVIRGQMDYYKTQLRDMYYKCMKDDQALLKETKTRRSYAWVVRSLWRIKEDINEQAFPSYLDSASVRFLLEYAKAQNELEEYCKEHRIMNLIANAEDFKNLNKTLDSAMPNETMPDNAWISEAAEFPNSPKNKIRSLDMLLGDVRSQMAAMKRENLKAKRQVAIGANTFKPKVIAFKWEEVDPNDFDKAYVPQQEQPHIESKLLKHDNHNKMVWDQGLEKLRAIYASRKKESERLIKQSLAKELDDRLRSNLQKTFLFLLGKLGQESYSKFLREKMVYDQNAQGKAKKANYNTNQMFTKAGSAVSSPATVVGNASQMSQRSMFESSFYRGENSPTSSMMSPMMMTTKGNFAGKLGGWTPRDGVTKPEFRSTPSQIESKSVRLSSPPIPKRMI